MPSFRDSEGSNPDIPNSQNDQENWNRLKNLIEQNHAFPCFYTFRFIILAEKKAHFLSLLQNLPVEDLDISKESAQGKYRRLIFRMMAKSGEEVLKVYELFQQHKALVSF